MTVPTRNMDQRGAVRLGRKRYVLVKQSDIVADPTSICEGCVAHRNVDKSLCGRLPNTCVSSKTVWINQPLKENT